MQSTSVLSVCWKQHCTHSGPVSLSEILPHMLSLHCNNLEYRDFRMIVAQIVRCG